MISFKMKLEQIVVILVCCSCLGDEAQAMSTVELTSSIDKSGRLAVCHNETIIYRCRITIVPTQSALIWKFNNISNLNVGPIVFHVNDSCDQRQFDDADGRFLAFLKNNPATDNYLLSYLVISYIPEWNGMVVQCTNGHNNSKELPYVITKSPRPPSTVHHTYTVTQDYVYVNLKWNTTTELNTDSSMVMITVGDKNMLNTSHQAGAATLDISEYRSNGSIAIEMYGMNKCGMMSNRSTKVPVILRPAETCLDKLLYVAFGLGVPLLLIGLLSGAKIASCYIKIDRSRAAKKASRAENQGHSGTIKCEDLSKN